MYFILEKKSKAIHLFILIVLIIIHKIKLQIYTSIISNVFFLQRNIRLLVNLYEILT
jgi:hypothetical protein